MISGPVFDQQFAVADNHGVVRGVVPSGGAWGRRSQRRDEVLARRQGAVEATAVRDFVSTSHWFH